MLYKQVSSNLFFITPTIAVGVDTDGLFFFEIAWFNLAVGLGSL